LLLYLIGKDVRIGACSTFVAELLDLQE
jgi:hypothetical protein